MGAAKSKSVSHFAHPIPGHCFKRLEAMELDRKVQCRMCHEEMRNGTPAYSCQQCSSRFFHDVCFLRLETNPKHWAHPSHPLTLSDNNHIDGRSCSICAGDFRPAAGAFVYGCCCLDSCHGFYVHPTCLDLSQTLQDDVHAHPLTLLPPPPDWRRGSCHDPTKCRNKGKPPPPLAWSYQCPRCKVHVSCLACQGGHIANYPSPGHPHRCGGQEALKALGCLGTFGRRFACACAGNNPAA